MSDSVVLSCSGLAKTYDDGSLKAEVLTSVDLDIRAGDQLAIVGSSGSGKSTLLHLLGGLDSPTAGEIQLTGKSLHKLGEAERGRLRNHTLGFIYQFHHLLNEFSALENVSMPLLIQGLSVLEASQRATEMLERVGLGHRLNHKPGELSGGERQRAAVARALVTKPRCVLADEPTGNLDSRNADQVFELMLELNQELDTALVVVTHDHDMAKRLHRVSVLEDGRLTD